MIKREDADPKAKGVQPFPISINPGPWDSLRIPKRPSRNNCMYTCLDVPPMALFPSSHSRTVSSPSSPFPASTQEEPAYGDYDELSNGFGALNLNASSTEPHDRRRLGRGYASSKSLDISLKSNPSSSLPRATPAKSMRHPPPPPARGVARTPTRAQTPQELTPFLNRFTNVRAPVYDDPRVSELEAKFNAFTQQIQSNMSTQDNLNTKNTELEATVSRYRSMLDEEKAKLDEQKSDMKELKSLLKATTKELDSLRKSHYDEIEDFKRKQRSEMQDLQFGNDQIRREKEEFKEKIEKLKTRTEELSEIEKKLKHDLEEERGKRLRDTQGVQEEYAAKLRNAGLDAETKQREAQLLQGELINIKSELDRERTLKNGLQAQLTESTTLALTLEAANKAMKEKIHFLESDSQAQSSAFNDLHARMQEAIEVAALANEKLRQEEMLRRKLHNQVQELKGNIRVMCRVRPTHASETEPANIAFPDADTDSKEVAVQGPGRTSALGTTSAQTYSYGFDRVFAPSSQNAEVFDEISQLVQSALDGYNVCIFCYGQTGSGKTFTMSSDDGMIPRATAQIYAEAKRLEEKGWRYKMEGSFVEVYNETYNDLLGRSEDIDKKKLEVRHDPAKKQTTLENAVTVELDGPSRVEEILSRASKNRSVAATKANMRSSRSHSVFILKLVGQNTITGERSEGTLNLVDLAGSERLEHSRAEGARLKETQNINKSLSCLGDVINALGSAKEGSHVPYRNSKLTYLLQYSLGGNSKTLMFVMVSPLQAHLQETVTSLKFATKVHNTHIGTAKKQTRA
ncbi:kinesin-domain-containing protein [Massarina eburnea CBS 473.64]|uniref:Kinesin-like protein n=1 Tax=Massarina eburnea CBS 473.64 TaxID=1395130 RepID=A0A6A6RHB7_9PLEO|nr:kinesin-domain-containing protein [Massarina eburnea CBS 473.64]